MVPRSGDPGVPRIPFNDPVIRTALTALLLNTFVPGRQSPLFDRQPEDTPETPDSPATDD